MAGDDIVEIERDGIIYIVAAEGAPTSAPATEPAPESELPAVDDLLANAAFLRPGEIIEAPATGKPQAQAAPASPPSSPASSSTPAPKSKPARSTRPASMVPPQSEIKLPIRGGGLVDKWRLLELVERRTKEGKLKPGDMGVLFYVANNSIRDTQVCRRQLRTIAMDLGRARSMVIESIGRLIKEGLLLRHQRRVNGGWKMSSDLALNYVALDKMRPHDDRSAGHDSSRSKNLPIKRGRPPDRSSEPSSIAPDDLVTPEQWRTLRESLKKIGRQGD